QCRQPVVLAFRPAIFDPQIVADEKASFAQSLAERGQQNILLKVSRSRTEITDGPWRRLLRARRKRPRHHGAAEQRDEIAASHPGHRRPPALAPPVGSIARSPYPQMRPQVLRTDLNRSEFRGRCQPLCAVPNDSTQRAGRSLHCRISIRCLSALGQERTLPVPLPMSALPPKADIDRPDG